MRELWGAGSVSSGKGNNSKNKWECIKLKRFYTVKETITNQKGNILSGRRYLQMTYLIRSLHSTYAKNSYNYYNNIYFQKQTIQLKTYRRPERIFFQRRHTDGQQAREKKLSITNHQGNANQNYSEISSHICQDGYYQKNNK